jgi:hypothetical protein
VLRIIIIIIMTLHHPETNVDVVPKEVPPFGQLKKAYHHQDRSRGPSLLMDMVVVTSTRLASPVGSPAAEPFLLNLAEEEEEEEEVDGGHGDIPSFITIHQQDSQPLRVGPEPTPSSPLRRIRRRLSTTAIVVCHHDHNHHHHVGYDRTTCNKHVSIWKTYRVCIMCLVFSGGLLLSLYRIAVTSTSLRYQ